MPIIPLILVHFCESQGYLGPQVSTAYDDIDTSGSFLLSFDQGRTEAHHEVGLIMSDGRVLTNMEVSTDVIRQRKFSKGSDDRELVFLFLLAFSIFAVSLCFF